jgi:serine phosphatase RsbU (regulator of sigma subunit)
MERVNTEFSGVTGGVTFATALLATCYGPTGELEISSAGHPAPLWYDTNRQMWSVLGLEPVPGKGGRSVAAGDNIPLGIFEGSTYGSLKTTLARGDLLLFYTDGVIESKAREGTMLGVEGLRAQVSRVPVADAGAILPRLMSEIEAWAGPEGITDDVTMLLVRLSSPARTKNPLRVGLTVLRGLLRGSIGEALGRGR